MAICKPEWLDILTEQEKLLLFDSLTQNDALRLGLLAIESARTYGGAFAVRIVMNGTTVFSHLMDGTGTYHEWWMQRKLNYSLLTGESTLRTFIELHEGLRPQDPLITEKGNYVSHGGCIPLHSHSGSILGHIIVSGGAHEIDHQIAADAMAAYLGVSSPSVISIDPH